MTARRIIRTYLGIAASTTLAQSLIWGINTLFLLSVGLDIFQVMVVNAAYTVAQVFFEVPTGVIADTAGAARLVPARGRHHLPLDAALHVVRARRSRRAGPFALASALLGLGYTFYTGAVDAWMVDALHSVDYPGKLEPIFARYGMTFGVFMLVGTTAGGFLGQLDLWIPYAVRALVLVPAFLLGLLAMRDLGFTSRPLTLGSFGSRDAAHRARRHHLRPAGPRGALHHVRDARPGRLLHLRLLLVAEVLPRPARADLVWVTGVIAACVGVTQILGNALVGRITEARRGPRPHPDGARWASRRRRSSAPLSCSSSGWRCRSTWCRRRRSASTMPVKQGWLNARIPSEERATIISLDALFGDGGMTVGQLGLGYLSQVVSIPPPGWSAGSRKRPRCRCWRGRGGRSGRSPRNPPRGPNARRARPDSSAAGRRGLDGRRVRAAVSRGSLSGAERASRRGCAASPRGAWYSLPHERSPRRARHRPARRRCARTVGHARRPASRAHLRRPRPATGCPPRSPAASPCSSAATRCSAWSARRARRSSTPPSGGSPCRSCRGS